MKRNGIVAFFLFVIAMACSARLSIFWPYIDNWPYTGLLYGGIFAVLTVIVVITLRTHFIRTQSKISAATIGASFLLYFLIFSAFWSFSLRYLTEPEIAHSFEKATVLEKYRSSNHNYPGLCIRYADGTTIKLDVPGQEEVWQEVQIGSVVSKHFGKQEITHFSDSQ